MTYTPARCADRKPVDGYDPWQTVCALIAGHDGPHQSAKHRLSPLTDPKPFWYSETWE